MYVARTVCGPVGTPVIVYRPRASVSVPRCVPSTDTWTPFSGCRPVLSITVPVTLPVCCAASEPVTSRAATKLPKIRLQLEDAVGRMGVWRCMATSPQRVCRLLRFTADTETTSEGGSRAHAYPLRGLDSSPASLNVLIDDAREGRLATYG